MSLKKIAKLIFFRLPVKVQCRILSFMSRGDLTMGKGSYIHGSVHLLGRSSIRLGENSCISEGGWLNVNHRNVSGFSIDIGDSCFIGKNNFFSSGKSISIGDFALTTIGCRFIGSGHIVSNPGMPYLLSGTTSDDVIRVGPNCFLGAGSTLLGNVTVGHGSVVAASSLVMADIPPFSLAVGSPARVIKRYSFAKNEWVGVDSFTPEDELLIPNEVLYLKSLRSKYSGMQMPWIAAGRNMGDL